MKTWNEAEVFCQQENGHLASVTSSAVNQYVTDGMNSRGFSNTWIGGNDIDEEETWKWTDNSPFGFTFWPSWEPNGGRSENCIHYKLRTNQIMWNDVTCSTSFTFVCSKKKAKISGRIMC